MKSTARKSSGTRRTAKPSAATRVARRAEAPDSAEPESSRRLPVRDVSAPEIKVCYAPAGRETLSAVAEELAMAAAVASSGDSTLSGDNRDSTPDLELGPKISLGLSAGSIARSENGDRIRQSTKGYGDRISNAPGAQAPRPPAIYASAPEIIVTHTPAGRETLAAINEELLDEPVTAVRSTQDGKDLAELDIYEMVTFLIRGTDLERLPKDSRQKFVLERLRHRLPIESAEEIERIDVTPWTVRGMVMLRVWCRVRPIGL